jgi:hypothetical protein
MSANFTSQELIASALQLPWQERKRILEVLQKSLVENSIDRDPNVSGSGCAKQSRELEEEK